MALRLLLLRHAKSDWNADYERDRDRPLSARGRRAAGTIGRFVTAADRVPDLVLSSAAVRTRQTTELATSAGNWGSQVEFLDELYGTHPAGVVDIVRGHAGVHRPPPATVMVVNHEPTCSGLVARLTGAHARYPTAALASIRLTTPDWSGLDASGVLEWFVTPKLIQKLSQDAEFGDVP